MSPINIHCICYSDSTARSDQSERVHLNNHTSNYTKRMYCGFVVVIREPVVPEVDLGFIISAGSTDSAATLRQIKAIIKSFIDKYSMNRLRYGIISYGSTPRVELALPDSVNVGVSQTIEAIRRPSGTPGLGQSSATWRRASVSRSTNRSESLVIITDVKSGSSISK